MRTAVGFLRLSRHLTLGFFPSSSRAADSAYSAETSAARETFQQLPWLSPSGGQDRNSEAARPACAKQGVNGKLGVCERLLKKHRSGRDFVVIWHGSSWYLSMEVDHVARCTTILEPDEVDLLVFEDIVPQDHYLRQVLRVINFERCRELLTSCYCLNMGRPAVDATPPLWQVA
jgi:hypothetical protein